MSVLWVLNIMFNRSTTIIPLRGVRSVVGGGHGARGGRAR